MTRNIILLSDGTGNSAAKLNKTNVWRTYRALDLTTGQQVAHYDDGVGTSSFRPLALLGSGFGFGLARNVRQLYAFLSRNSKDVENDQVFAFGFSRGAYTIRLLIGLVSNQGLVDPELQEEEFQRQVMCRWDAFRKQRFPWFGAPTGPTSGTTLRMPRFKFVGLWDTVGAYGLPFEELQGLIPIAQIRDRHLSSIVDCAYHALSLDDERRSFHPVLWDESDPKDSDRIQQVWFPGVHSNIGGGYPKDGLSYVSLNWIITKARKEGLHFHCDHLREIAQQANVDGQMYNSRAFLGGYYRYSPRPVTRLGNDKAHGVKIERPKVHESAFARIREGRVAYGPIGIPLVYELILTSGGHITGPCDVQEGPNGKTEIVNVEHTDGTKSKFLEVADRARQRADRMEVAWNSVWWRRIVYYLTLLSTLFLIALPSFADALSTKQILPIVTEQLGRYLEPILTGARFLVPAWVGKTWFGAFEKEPVLFLIGLVSVAVTMVIGILLEKRIHYRAGDIWHFKPKDPVPNWARNPKSTLLFKLRSCEGVVALYQWYRSLSSKAAPLIFLIVCAGVIVWAWKNHRDYVIAYAIVIALAVVLRQVWHYWATKERRST